MQDAILNEPGPAPRRSGMGRALLAVGLLAFILGAVLVGAVAWYSGLTLDRVLGRPQPAPPASAPAPVEPLQVAAPSVMMSGLDQRLAALEQRLTHLDLQAEAASGNAARAEGLLIAFAARRMLDKGAPLGYLSDQLKLRFADAQPNAVATIIEASGRAVTLDDLTAQLHALAPALTGTPADESGWARLRREISTLFVIRHDSRPSPDAASRVDRALLSLRQGRIDDAIGEVQRLPNAGAAAAWVEAARRHQTTQQALDLIETTALLEPRRLNDTAGEKVEQPSPAASPPS